MKQVLLISLLCFALMGNIVHASVSINEVAWMGGIESANHEWIEIYNDSDTSLSVDGWTLSDGQNLLINLSGSIASGAFAVLERTTEESALGQSFLIYTGALVNTGATLTLKDVNGQIVDQVVGGTDWINIGGDNTTKETAQYSTNGWVTDVGTPGKVNGIGRKEEVIVPEVDVPKTSSNIVTKSSKNNKSSDTIILRNPESKMTLIADVQEVGYVNQKIIFRAFANGLSSADGKLVRYEWNFGDSFTATTTKAEHFYKYPGNYIVTIYARNGKNEQVIRHDLTILPVNLSLSFDENRNLQINNNSAYDIDISGYELRGNSEVILPQRTIIGTLGTITIDGERIAGRGIMPEIRLYDAKKNLVTSTFEDYLENESISTNDSVLEESDNRIINNQKIVQDFNFIPKVAEASSDVDVVEEIKGEQIINPISQDTGREVRWPYFALISILLVASLALVVGKK